VGGRNLHVLRGRRLWGFPKGEGRTLKFSAFSQPCGYLVFETRNRLPAGQGKRSENNKIMFDLHLPESLHHELRNLFSLKCRYGILKHDVTICDIMGR